MNHSKEDVIKDLAPYLGYIFQHYGEEITLEAAIEVAEKARYSVQTLQIEGQEFSHWQVLEEEISQYFLE